MSRLDIGAVLTDTAPEDFGVTDPLARKYVLEALADQSLYEKYRLTEPIAEAILEVALSQYLSSPTEYANFRFADGRRATGFVYFFGEGAGVFVAIPRRRDGLITSFLAIDARDLSEI